MALVLASIYGMFRFYYYGFMLGHSPQRHRKDALRKLHATGTIGTYDGSVFLGPAAYSTTPSIEDRHNVETQLSEIINVFPKGWHFRPQGSVEAVRGIDDHGEVYTVYHAEIAIPFACRVAAFLQDLDYSAPVWLNLVAITLALLWV